MTAMFQPPPDTVTAAPDPDLVPTYNARDLIKVGTQVRLFLDGQAYYLRITRAGKLILTK